MFVYTVTQSGILSGPVELPVVPGLGRVLPASAIELPERLAVRPGHVWIYRDGQVAELADHRGTYYRTDSGERIEHAELGDLPEGLTPDPRPGPYHVWRSGTWVLDEAAQLATVQADERAWRNVILQAVEWQRDRHRDQQEIGIATTLTAEQYRELLQYIQALRDWPQSEIFPSQTGRPQPPEWLVN